MGEGILLAILCPGVASLCRYNAVTGEWLEDEVLIKMASQVSCPWPSGDRAECRFFLTRLLYLFPPLHTHLIVLTLGHSLYYCVFILFFVIILLRYNSPTIQHTHLKRRGSVVFGIVTELCNHHHDGFQNISPSPKETPYLTHQQPAPNALVSPSPR